MDNFTGRIAVITGAGTGMGRELAVGLAREGAHLALCDIELSNLDETRRLCERAGPDELRISTHEADVSDESAVLAFRDEALAAHETSHVNLVFNNAGIGGVESLVDGDRAQWERVFNVCWYGVYYGTRAFLPALVASKEGYLVNTSSINGFWASMGPSTPHSAYCAAKFAVKGFTEALVSDLRAKAPHVKVAVVMPGHIGTAILMNSRHILGTATPEQMTAEDLLPIREEMRRVGVDEAGVSDGDLRALLQQRFLDFQNEAPTTAARAAAIILDGLRQGRWRILVGEDAEFLDAAVRERPEQAYEVDFLEGVRAQGHLVNLIQNI